MVWQKRVIFLLVFLLTGCRFFSQQEGAPVTQLEEGHTPVFHGVHIVQRGETLYEIAWKYGRDYRDLAINNQIAEPYRIYPGQKLNLAKRHLLKPINKFVPQSTTKNKQVVAKALPLSSASAIKALPFKNEREWPAHGRIIKAFKLKGFQANKGIDIAGVLGAPVKASNAGKVVYCGNGLRGYGQLIIIKHNETYLSAYAHNSRLLVKEHQEVARGQVIAYMGKSDAKNVNLHFEIRKNGQPINPLMLLPRKPA